MTRSIPHTVNVPSVPDGLHSAKTLPSVTIVVIGRNEAAHLPRCFAAIRALAYPPERVQLIYVDSGSTDASCDIATAHGALVVRLTEGRQSAARARNAGLNRATGEYVQFVDGDSTLFAGWLDAAVRAFDDPNVVAVFGRIEELRPDASPYMRVCSLDWERPTGPTAYCGGNALLRRAPLLACGGFREDLVAGEEPELCYRLRRSGHTILHIHDRMAQHDLDMMTFGQYWRRGVRTGWALAVVGWLCRHGPERLWRRENLVVAGETLLWTSFLVVAAVRTDHLWLLVLVTLLALRITAIAIRSRRRAQSWRHALEYSVHCVVLRLAMFVGQVRGAAVLLAGRVRARDDG